MHHIGKKLGKWVLHDIALIRGSCVIIQYDGSSVWERVRRAESKANFNCIVIVQFTFMKLHVLLVDVDRRYVSVHGYTFN